MNVWSIADKFPAKPATIAAMRFDVITLGLMLLSHVQAALNATESSARIILANDRLTAFFNKSTGAIDYLTLDDQDLLGTANFETPIPGGSTGSGNSGIGPYLDCYCIPSGSYTPGGENAVYKLIVGTDSSGTTYGGVVMSDVYPSTGQLLEQYWFLRNGETGLHTFSRLAYYNDTAPFLRNLQEFRTLFRPHTPLWTHLITNGNFYAPQPNPNPAAGGVGIQTTVQDATWYLGNRTNDPYVEQISDYFTKYTFQDTWRDADAHGMFADGTQSFDNSTFGAWLVMNTKDTYFGGPIHSDLVVDGIVYNYLVSNHHGDGTPNITNGFDRTFGPQYYYFNKGLPSASIEQLRGDALQYASPSFASDFYDSIAEHVPNYVPSSQRGCWKARLQLPGSASNTIAVLAQNGVDFQDNVLDTKAYQYWANVDTEGNVNINGVKADTYRLTVYADGIFGWYIIDGIVVEADQTTDSGTLQWTPESAGTELWRIGTPDKSSGEFKHGYQPDVSHPLHPEEYRIYWGAYDFIEDFPNGVNFHIGSSKEAEDFNYVHWSVFGGYANFLRPQQEAGEGQVNNWTITFDTEEGTLHGMTIATFTVQLAGAKTAAGNTDVFNKTQAYNDLPFVVSINGRDLDPWIIP